MPRDPHGGRHGAQMGKGIVVTHVARHRAPAHLDVRRGTSLAASTPVPHPKEHAMFSKTALTIPLALSLALCAAVVVARPSAALAQSSTTSQTASAADTTFLQTAGRDGQAEVALARLAQRKTSNDDVKSFAAHLQSDHEKANSQLTSLARAKKVTVPAMSAEQGATRDRLDKLSGAEFDRAYISEMIAAHQKAIDAFTNGASSADADVKGFASSTLPTLKAHLSEAQKLQQELGAS
jgi:putative membrane protein